MSIISWNCRGLGTPWVVQALKKAICKEDPSLVFLMETKLIGSEMKKLQEEVGLSYVYLLGCGLESSVLGVCY